MTIFFDEAKILINAKKLGAREVFVFAKMFASNKYLKK
jgi:hypothetical protein